MGLITLVLLAIALCFDSFAVSLSCGMQRCEVTRSKKIRLAVILALFQAVMPFIGWSVAFHFNDAIEAYDHWIAFILLLLLGGKMIFESLGSQDEEENKSNPFSLKYNLLLGLATSIDALIAGVAMAVLPLTLIAGASQRINMLLAILIIGLITFLASMIGLFLGRCSQGRLGSRSEIIGGVILILIGLKVLWEHL